MSTPTVSGLMQMIGEAVGNGPRWPILVEKRIAAYAEALAGQSLIYGPLKPATTELHREYASQSTSAAESALTESAIAEELAKHNWSASFSYRQAFRFGWQHHAGLAASSAPQAEPMAWAHEDGRVISASTKATAERDGGASASSVRGYTIPLFAATPSVAVPPQPVPEGWRGPTGKETNDAFTEQSKVGTHGSDGWEPSDRNSFKAGVFWAFNHYKEFVAAAPSTQPVPAHVEPTTGEKK